MDESASILIRAQEHFFSNGLYFEIFLFIVFSTLHKTTFLSECGGVFYEL